MAGRIPVAPTRSSVDRWTTSGWSDPDDGGFVQGRRSSAAASQWSPTADSPRRSPCATRRLRATVRARRCPPTCARRGRPARSEATGPDQGSPTVQDVCRTRATSVRVRHTSVRSRGVEGRRPAGSRVLGTSAPTSRWGFNTSRSNDPTRHQSIAAVMRAVATPLRRCTAAKR